MSRNDYRDYPSHLQEGRKRADAEQEFWIEQRKRDGRLGNLDRKSSPFFGPINDAVDDSDDTEED